VAVVRLALSVPVVLVGLLLAGCGAESPRQAGARVAVQGTLSAARYEIHRTRCTSNPAPWFIERQTSVFVCLAYRRDGGCDWYSATLRNAGWEVVRERTNAGCILPF
jgi:hypothetical protein